MLIYDVIKHTNSTHNLFCKSVKKNTAKRKNERGRKDAPQLYRTPCIFSAWIKIPCANYFSIQQCKIEKNYFLSITFIISLMLYIICVRKRPQSNFLRVIYRIFRPSIYMCRVVISNAFIINAYNEIKIETILHLMKRKHLFPIV